MGQKVGHILRSCIKDGLTDESLTDQVIHGSAFEESLKDFCLPFVQRCATIGAFMEWELHAKRLEGDKGFFDAISRMPKTVANGVAMFVRNVTDVGQWDKIINTVRSQTSKIITQFKNILSGPDLVSKVVDQVFGASASEVRANNIARTVSITAINGGGQVARDELTKKGAVRRKMWRTMRDNVVRPTHREAEGQIVSSTGFFTVGGESCMYPGDPSLSAKERCSCRCTAISLP